mmetsp:Transcript_12051/g.24034  ORF Transcript_12051/g.24034 Transcript_12051/m.24034 type:complete len:137 (-) Transcript_12051:267-677(-)
MKRRPSRASLILNGSAAECLPKFVKINILDGARIKYIPTLKQKLEKPSRVLGYEFLDFCKETDENDEYKKLDHAGCTFEAISRKKEPSAPVEDEDEDYKDLAYSDQADDPANAFLFCCNEDDDYQELDHGDDAWAS